MKLVIFIAFLSLGLQQIALADDFIIESSVLPDTSEIPTLANGHVGFVVFGDAMLMNGVYNGLHGESHRARIPNYSNIKVDMPCRTEKSCSYKLNMREAYFEKTIGLDANYGIFQKIYAHRFYNRAIINQVYVIRDTSTLSSSFAIDINLDPGFVPGVDVLQSGTDKIINIANREVITRCFVTRQVEDPTYQKVTTPICVAHTNPPASIELLRDQLSGEYMHVTTVGLTEDEVVKEITAVLENIETVFDRHIVEWKEHWERFGISVTGNDRLNQIIHASIFYLISNLPSEKTYQPKGPFYGLSPSGIGKGGILYAEYQGHSFWDTEMWMHPPLLLLNPQWSEDILSYRYMVRQAAKNNADATNFKGYRYPWESAYTGREVTPDCCPEVVEFQHHIISDIAFAFRSHFAATHDADWFKTVGCDIAWNTAKFWESRVKFNESTEYYDIRHVMGPDEDHHDIDNNVYTNVNAAINLYFGDYAGCACKDILNVTDDEHANFVKVAKSLKLLYDEERDFHPQFENYNYETIKQADAVLLGFPLQFPMNASTKRNNLIIYDNVTRENGPAMTWAMHTVGFLDLHDEEEAAKVFERSFNQYTREPFKVWSEVIPGTVGAGNFITGAGGFLQSVINGYGGVRLHFDRLSITNFYVPPQSTSLEFSGITYLNNLFSLSISGTQAVVKFIRLDPEHIIKVHLGDKEFTQTEILSGITFNRDQELNMEAAIKPFNTCEMKKTEMGQKAGVSTAFMSLLLLAATTIITMKI